MTDPRDDRFIETEKFLYDIDYMNCNTQSLARKINDRFVLKSKVRRMLKIVLHELEVIENPHQFGVIKINQFIKELEGESG